MSRKTGEFELIDRLRSLSGKTDGITGIGDDCAIIPQESAYDTLVSTDMLVEGSHFILEDISPFQLGWKSAAVNFSDIAAMGGKPQGSFLSFALPEKVRGEWTEEFIRGYMEISRKYGFPLLGGDTTASDDKLCICVTVLGKSVSGKAKLRSTAIPGDLVCVTGTLGDSATGLQVILRGLERMEDENQLIERHYLPTPRIPEGIALSEFSGVHAMMDISDGIGSDLRHIMEESKVGAEIDLESIPLSESMKRVCDKAGIDRYEMAVSGGEDYELLFTVNPEDEPSLTVNHYVIGRITEGDKLIWKGGIRDYSGFSHF